MLNENLKHLLSYVNKNAGDKFAIVMAEDILLDFPKEFNVKKEDLFDMFRILNSKGLIRLKYNDGSSFCCLMSEKGIEYLEESKIPIPEPTQKPSFSILGWCVFASFIGGFIGGAVSIVLNFLL